VTGRPFGIVVNNRHKYRVAESLVRMIGPDGSAGYRCGYTGNFQLTGGAILGSRWLGLHTMPRDAVMPFPNESGYNRDQLRSAFDTYLDFTQRHWNSNALTAHGWPGWTTRLWRNGDPYCGLLPANGYNRVYNTDDNGAIRCGNTYAAYSHQKGYRTASPEQSIAGHDWYREFLTYFIRALNRGVDAGNGVGGQYAIHGRLVDDFCNGADGHSVTCAYGAPFLSSSAAGLVSTPALFNPKPVGVARVNNDITATVVEGCAGGNNGRVTFTHNESFHPNPSASILAYQWDVDLTNGLWWEIGPPPTTSPRTARPPSPTPTRAPATTRPRSGWWTTASAPHSRPTPRRSTSRSRPARTWPRPRPLVAPTSSRSASPSPSRARPRTPTSSAIRRSPRPGT
jgi:hypothetical protein